MARAGAAPTSAAGEDAAAGPGAATRRRSRRSLDRLSGEGYRVRNLGRGVVGATGAGVVSALLGIGGGIIKVPLMHLAMGVPLRVATATSNLMIGITAAASAVIYLHPRRHRPVRRRPDGDRRLPRRDGRLAARPPGRPPRACGCCSSSCSATRRVQMLLRALAMSADPRRAVRRSAERRIGRLLIAMTYLSVALARRSASC